MASHLFRFAQHGAAAAMLVALAACSGPLRPSQGSPDSFHNQLLVLDSHLDTPVHFGRPGWNIADRHGFVDDLSQVDLPRMVDGGLDGGFFVIFTPQGPLTPDAYTKAHMFALRRAGEIRQVVQRHPGALALVTTPAEARQAAADGRRVVFQSIENSYPLGTSTAALEDFYDRGVRMASPVHSRNNQFADSTTDTPQWHGLSPLGREWVAEMNRLGMLIDASHASDEAFDQMLALSRAPIILSHSGPRAVFDHPRNIDDARLTALAAKGGVVQINSVFLAPTNQSPAWRALLDERDKLHEMTPQEQKALARRTAAEESRDPYITATFELFMASLLHTLKLVGPDHVGIGADWDGGGGVRGMEDVAALPRITDRLKAAGYSDADIAKIWSGNLLRVVQAAQDAADR
ncbi:dipeptidase [Sphingomonas flavalba]|uniref:dipeptidase n=1 Tax=Sphingomonas flavalba TaxID=2559804 RepID=UPI001EF01A68|nr:dipeptidase [Sphingomonas flavalba]